MLIAPVIPNINAQDINEARRITAEVERREAIERTALRFAEEYWTIVDRTMGRPSRRVPSSRMPPAPKPVDPPRPTVPPPSRQSTRLAAGTTRGATNNGGDVCQIRLSERERGDRQQQSSSASYVRRSTIPAAGGSRESACPYVRLPRPEVVDARAAVRSSMITPTSASVGLPTAAPRQPCQPEEAGEQQPPTMRSAGHRPTRLAANLGLSPAINNFPGDGIPRGGGRVRRSARRAAAEARERIAALVKAEAAEVEDGYDEAALMRIPHNQGDDDGGDEEADVMDMDVDPDPDPPPLSDSADMWEGSPSDMEVECPSDVEEEWPSAMVFGASEREGEASPPPPATAGEEDEEEMHPSPPVMTGAKRKRKGSPAEEEEEEEAEEEGEEREVSPSPPAMSGVQRPGLEASEEAPAEEEEETPPPPPAVRGSKRKGQETPGPYARPSKISRGDPSPCKAGMSAETTSAATAEPEAEAEAAAIPLPDIEERARHQELLNAAQLTGEDESRKRQLPSNGRRGAGRGGGGSGSDGTGRRNKRPCR